MSSILKGILRENLLINIRTYDDRALILYAHDNFNNFVHLYITNANEIVYLYNHGNEIVNLTVINRDLNSGKSIQIALIRSENSTVLHVNSLNVTLEKGVLLLEEYSNKPWINPEVEVLSPHRPPAPTVQYFQLNLAGYDPSNLLRANNNSLEGLIGCVRGLMIGEWYKFQRFHFVSSSHGERERKFPFSHFPSLPKLQQCFKAKIFNRRKSH